MQLITSVLVPACYSVPMFAAATRACSLVPLNYRLGSAQLSQLLEIISPRSLSSIGPSRAGCKRQGRASFMVDPLRMRSIGRRQATRNRDQGLAITTISKRLRRHLYQRNQRQSQREVAPITHTCVSYVLSTGRIRPCQMRKMQRLVSVTPPYHIAIHRRT